MANTKEVLELEVKSDIGEVVEQTEKLDGAAKKGAKGFKGIGTAIKGVGTALKAAGIGLVVALMAKLMEVFSKNQKVVDTFDTAMTSLSIVFNDLFSFLNDNVGKVTGFFKDLFENPKENIIEFGNAIKDNLIERFNSLLDTFGHLGSALKSLFEGDFKGAIDSVKDAGKESIDVFTGVNNSVDMVTEAVTKGTKAISEYTKSTIDQAKAITETNKAAQLAAVEFARLNAQYLKDAEVQRQIRDDETKTFAERIKANDDLSKVLEEQQELQREQVQTQIDAAQAQFNLNGSIENRIALGEANNAMLELEETITGQMSEQKTNQVALEKELLEAQNQLRAEGLTGMGRELDELKTAYEAKLEMARKSGVDITAITAEYEKQQTDIIEAAAEEQKGIDQQVAAAKVDAIKQGLQVIQSIMDVQAQQTENDYNNELKMAEGNEKAIEGIEKKYDAIRTEEAKKHQKMQIAMALVDTYQSAVSAYANAIKIPYAGLALAPISAGLAVAAGLANVAMISKQPLGGGGGGGGGTVAATTETPAPQMMSGAFELGGGVEPEPLKAFVVTDEMTSSQNQLANIRRRATI